MTSARTPRLARPFRARRSRRHTQMQQLEQQGQALEPATLFVGRRSW